MLTHILAAFKKHNANGKIYGSRDFTILPGVSSDEGKDDEWKDIRKHIIECDIFVLGTPIWLG